MDAIEATEQELREALSHLYDPAYQPTDRLWQELGVATQDGLPALWEAIVRAIKSLTPGQDVPHTARAWRIYGMLYYRYVENATQEETAERLGITSRHLRREQADAVHVLALRLLENKERPRRTPVPAAAPAVPPAPARDDESGGSPEWRAQLRQELASLREGAPWSVAEVGETAAAAAGLAGALTVRRGVRVETDVEAGSLVVAVHPAALRQVLLATIRELAGRMPAGLIRVQAAKAGSRIHLTINAAPAATEPPFNAGFIEEVLDVPDGIVEAEAADGGMAVHIDLPAVEHTILVVDDNPDMAHLYRRYTTGTGYYVVHVAQGKKLFEAAENCAPAAIVLDVMLPDIDGWALLSQLREHPFTHDLPIIVCSVMREEELALALGATAYLRKPIAREQFLGALHAALSQAPT